MPDCCVLLAAKDTGAPVATFDTALAEAAHRAGVSSVPPHPVDEPGPA